ncbi:unnamed protein product [Heterobilharzia americana]|nr:unnamed protein product [Heterobilharzia americana]
MWHLFESVLLSAHQNSSCIMPPELYDSFVQKAFEKQPPVKDPHFYSQVFGTIRAMCKRLGVCSSLETTLPGYLFDELNWCMKNFTGNASYGTPCGCNETSKVVLAFWESASAMYAKKVSGDVIVVLNGSVALPLRENGTFVRVEFPLLVPPRVRKITVKLIHNARRTNYHHTCESLSIRQFASIVKSRSISYECINDPPEFKHFLCIEDPYISDCQFSSSSIAKYVNNSLFFAFLLFYSVVHFFII